MTNHPTGSDEADPGTADDGLTMPDLVTPLWSEERTRDALGGLSAADVGTGRTDGSLLGLQAANSGASEPKEP